MASSRLKTDFTRLYKHISPRRRRQFVLLFFMMVLGAAADLLSISAIIPFLALLSDPSRIADFPILSDWLAPSVIGEGRVVQLVTVAFITATIIATVIRMSLAYFNNRLSHAMGADLTIAVYERVLWQPYAWHVRQPSKRIIAAVNKTQVLVRTMIKPVLNTLTVLISGLLILAFIVALEPLIVACIIAVIATSYILVSRFVRHSLRRNSQVINQAQTQKVGAVQEALGGVRDVLLDQSQSVFTKRFRGLEARFRRALAQNAFLAPAPRFMMEAIGMTAIAIAAYSLAQRENGFMEALPLLGALALSAQRLLPMFQTFYASWTSLTGSYAVREEVLDLLDLSLPGAAPGGKINFEKNIRFDGVSYRYDETGPWVLRGLDFEIERGACFGLVGANGSGKSTTLDILTGLLAPTEGNVLLDGTRLDYAKRRAWQRQLAHVPQYIYLSSASVRENIAFGVETKHIDDARVSRCAELAHLGEFILSLPKGFETLIGEGGHQLSGGQRQKLGIARALYKQAEVLILDEVTSALDTSAEQKIIECIDDLKGAFTIIVVSHRPACLRPCDSILFLHEGKIKRQLTHGQYEQLSLDSIQEGWGKDTGQNLGVQHG